MSSRDFVGQIPRAEESYRSMDGFRGIDKVGRFMGFEGAPDYGYVLCHLSAEPRMFGLCARLVLRRMAPAIICPHWENTLQCLVDYDAAGAVH
jgi:hypothetical protein